MNMKSMKEAALNYAAKGYRVFPLVRGEKRPSCANGCKDATTDRAKIEAWWTNDPQSNIGLACGCGIAVVDIDRHNGVDGMRSITEARLTLPKTLTQHTPSGGLHLVCRGDGIRNATNVNNIQGVDVRGEGGYIVAAPSVVNGVVYAWENEGEELAEFPQWAIKKATVAQPTFVPEHHTGDVSIERVKAYLAKMPAAVQGQSGHEALLKAAEVVAVRFALPKEQAKSLLWSEFNPRCSPPWDYANTKERRDFERKVEEAVKHPRHTFGDLRDATCPEMVAAQEEIDMGMRIAFGGNVKGHDFTKDEAVRKSILNPPGIVGEIANWITKNSPRPVPLFSVVGALAVCGTAFARSVRRGQSMTNPFFFVVGPAQSGKSSVFKLADAFMSEIQRRAGCEDHQFFMQSSVTSDAALKAHLQKWGRLTLIVDECAGFFSQINGAAKTGGHMAAIKDCIKQLYSVGSTGKMDSTIYAPDHGKMRDPYKCDGACFSFIGGTQPAVFARVITDAELFDGFLGRMIFVIQSSFPDSKRDHEGGWSPFPQHAIDSLASFMTGCAIDDNSVPKEGTRRYLSPKNYEIRISPDADVIAAALKKWEDDTKKASNSTGDMIVDNLTGRVYENTMRIALIASAGKYVDDLDHALIDKECWTFAENFVKTAYNDLVTYCREAGESSDYDRYKDKIVDFVRRKGPVTKSQISQGVRGAKGRKYRDDAIEDLVSEGKIRKDVATYVYAG